MSTRKRPRRTKPADEVITTKKKKKDDHNDNPYLERVRICRRHKAISGCTNVDDQYETLDEISTGAYGFVFRARDKKTGEIVAIKRELDGLNETSLREIEILKSLDRHPSVVEFKKVAVDDDEGVYVVMEYLNNDLRRYIYSPKSSKPFNRTEVKYLMKQLLEGVKFLHDNGVMHRDLKPENILMRKLNRYPKLKICDFGLSRHFESTGLGSSYTPNVVTLWYRAPEVLLGLKSYSSKIDMWSVGCVMAELLLKKSLFRGETEFGQLKEIYGILGTPNENVWPGFNKLPGSKSKIITQPYNQLRDKVPAGVLTEVGFDLLNKLLAYDPAKRISAEDALNHDWFKKRKNKL